jgi:hypothetical protein
MTRTTMISISVNPSRLSSGGEWWFGFVIGSSRRVPHLSIYQKKYTTKAWVEPVCSSSQNPRLVLCEVVRRAEPIQKSAIAVVNSLSEVSIQPQTNHNNVAERIACPRRTYPSTAVSRCGRSTLPVLFNCWQIANPELESQQKGHAHVGALSTRCRAHGIQSCPPSHKRQQHPTGKVK